MGFFSKLLGGLAGSGADHSYTDLKQLDTFVVRLSKGELAEGFFGLISAETGSIYFMLKEGEYSLDLEIFNEHDEPFAEKFRKWASENGKQVIETTYGNPDEQGKEAPVLRVNVGTTPDSIHKAGISYLQGAYGVAMDHNFDVVP